MQGQSNIGRFSITACDKEEIDLGLTTCLWLVLVAVKQSHYKPGQTVSVPGGCDSFIPRQSAHKCCKVIPTHLPPLPPRKHYCYSFLLEAESAPGLQYGWKDYDTIGNRTRDLPACSAVPQPTAPPAL
jgi:hypothetical protein